MTTSTAALATPTAPAELTVVTDPELRALAVRTDKALAELDQAYAGISAQRDGKIGTLRHIDGQRAHYVGRRREYAMTAAETVASVQAKLADGTLGGRDLQTGRDPQVLLDEIARLADQATRNRADADVLQDVWASNGYWSRYFVVPGGHIHNDISNRCSRTWTTQHGWSPELSGASEAEAVAELGPLLCTHCFPSAPVEFTRGHDKPAACEGSGRAAREGSRTRHGMRHFGQCSKCTYDGQLTPSGFAIRKHQPQN